MEDSYKRVIDLINDNKKFLILSHAHPDGDAIGSTLALGISLKAMGKDVTMYNEDGVPRVLDFLPGAFTIVTEISSSDKFDATIMLDCAQPERAGKHFPSEVNRGALVCIDHHLSTSNAASVSCLDDTSASTGEVVYNIIKRLGVPLNADIATLILTTIIVDTGFFRYSNTGEATLKVAAELVGMGASTWTVCKNMEERDPPERLTLLALALNTIEYFLDNQLAIMVLTQQMLTTAGANVEVAEEFINFPRSIDGVEVAVLIREKTSNEFKISFRSKEFVDVAGLVAKYDGGGHKHAAGCELTGPLGMVKQTVVAAVKEALTNLNKASGE